MTTRTINSAWVAVGRPLHVMLVDIEESCNDMSMEYIAILHTRYMVVYKFSLICQFRLDTQDE